MEKKKLVILAVSMLLLVGIFGVIAVTITNSETNTQAKADASEDTEKSGQTSEGGGKEAAETLSMPASSTMGTLQSIPELMTKARHSILCL